MLLIQVPSSQGSLVLLEIINQLISIEIFKNVAKSLNFFEELIFLSWSAERSNSVVIFASVGTSKIER